MGADDSTWKYESGPEPRGLSIITCKCSKNIGALKPIPITDTPIIFANNNEVFLISSLPSVCTTLNKIYGKRNKAYNQKLNGLDMPIKNIGKINQYHLFFW